MNDEWSQGTNASAADMERDYAAIVGRFQHPLATYLFQFVGDQETARDLTQEVFVKAYRHLRGYDPARPFSTWLFAIAANHARDHLRRRRLIVEPLEAESICEPVSKEPRPDQALVHAELGDDLARAMAQLSLADREIVVLRHVAGLGIEEISQTLGIGASAAKTRLFRARQQLQVLLAHISA